MKSAYIHKPDYLKIRLPGRGEFREVKNIIKKYGLHTVCEEAKCPNLGECWGHGTATFMILGDTCTRNCKFCAVKTGNPHGMLEQDEPLRVAMASAEMKLSYVVLTSVTRDDLPEGGAGHFARTVQKLKEINPMAGVEVLTPDFRFQKDAIKTVVMAGPDVFGHNIEVVRRLSPLVRDRRAGYDQSLNVLAYVKEINGNMFTKSSIMVGLGETKEEIIEAMKDLRNAKVDFLTIGQYLQPTRRHFPVSAYITPEEFSEFRDIGLSLGFKYVASRPLVRSSYRAGEFFKKVMLDSTADKF